MNKAFVLIALVTLAACGAKEEPKETARPVRYEGAPQQVSEVIGIGKVEPELDLVRLATNDGGVVTRVHVREGDAVRPGMVILELENSVAAAKLPQVRARLTTQEAQIAADQKTVAEAETRLANLERTLNRNESLYTKSAETLESLQNAESEVRLQKSVIERLRANVQVSRNRLIEIRSDLAIAERELALKTVKAPIAGTILNISATPGSAVPPQTSFAELAPDGNTIVRCEIDELFADRVKKGQQASIRQIGVGKALAEGKVIYTAPLLKKKSLFSETAGEKEDRRVREVKILLNNAGSLLLNSRVECVISIQ
ncbi:MAG: efflux RND transporter periplasmic adaptor subunit [Saprospiraceae bacterium]|nr:efflux RND transporter periplasmic adaptor subunit [Saprospiraceae bacterium]